MLPLLMDHSKADLRKKQNRVQLIMYSANTYFFVQVVTWAGFMLAFTDYEDKKRYAKVLDYDAVNKLVPAIILIISVLLFRCRFKSKQSQKVFAREKIIVVHVVLFLFFVVVYALNLILYSYWLDSPQGPLHSCRYYLSSVYFELFYISSNIAILTLFIYMSMMFSRPVTGYWEEFLLSYRKQSLSQAV